MRKEADRQLMTAAGINTIHDRVHGMLRAPAGAYAGGEKYSAHDPELLRWVHATLLESVPSNFKPSVGHRR